MESSFTGRLNCLTYIRNAAITPTVMMPLNASHPPKAATMTKLIFPIAFITGPKIPLRVSVRTPAFVRRSDVSSNDRITEASRP